MALQVSAEELAAMRPQEFRELVRKEEWTDFTLLACRNYAQNNLAIVPRDYAYEFLLFCMRNPRPCPVIDVTEPGSPYPMKVAPTADLRTDLPRYRVFKNGELVDEPTDVTKYWQDDLVAFLIGCSATFDWALRAANVNFRLLGAYTSNIQCVPAGPFHGPMVVSCRAFKTSEDAVRAVQIGSRYLVSHGPPIHIGDPSIIGIKDLMQPDQAAINPLPAPEPDEAILTWGCGITPQTTALAAKLPILITHKAGHMFINDFLAEETANL